MCGYRCYFLDERDRFRDVEAFTAADDNEAIGKAQYLIAERDCFAGFEVWQGARCVAASTVDQGASDQLARFLAQQTAQLLHDLDQIEGRLDLVERVTRSMQERQPCAIN